jgi:hypothetical protein
VYSQLTFTGAAVPISDQTTPILLGAIMFLNGTSELASIIFGATLTFSLNGVTLGSDNVVISTTSNQYSGLGLSVAQLNEDADYVNICGNSSNICNQSIEAYEDTEGGTGVTVDLYGTYTVDPGIDLTSVVLDPNQSGSINGIVGNLPPLGATVPEPTTWMMLFLGFAAVGYTLRRRGNRALSAA